MALTLLLAGSMAYERQSGMTFLLRAVPRGRGALLICKVIVAALAAAAVWATVYGMELYALFCGAILVLLVSSCVKRAEIAYIAGCGVMLIPSLLYAYVGIEVFRPLSFIISVEAVPLLTYANGAITQFLLWGVALVVIAGMAIGWLLRAFAGGGWCFRNRFDT